MGRVKLQIKKIDDLPKRQVTYCKRSGGLLKKAYELSVLCATEVGVVMFSPAGKPMVFCSNGEIEQLVTRFANTVSYDRPKRLTEQLEKFHMAVRKLNNQQFEQREARDIQPASGDEEVMKLQHILDQTILERQVWEEKAKLFRGERTPQNVRSVPQLLAVEIELMHGLVKLRQQKDKLATSAQIATESSHEDSRRQPNMLQPEPADKIEAVNSVNIEEPCGRTCASIDAGKGNDPNICYKFQIEQQVGPVQHDIRDPMVSTPIRFPLDASNDTRFTVKNNLNSMTSSGENVSYAGQAFLATSENPWSRNASQAAELPLVTIHGNQFELQGDAEHVLLEATHGNQLELQEPGGFNSFPNSIFLQTDGQDPSQVQGQLHSVSSDLDHYFLQTDEHVLLEATHGNQFELQEPGGINSFPNSFFLQTDGQDPSQVQGQLHSVSSESDLDQYLTWLA